MNEFCTVPDCAVCERGDRHVATPGPATFRVLCPDGHVVDIITCDDPDKAENWARHEADVCNQHHDEAQCGYHIVERAEWVRVTG